MGLIGTILEAGPHPQALVDALYEEVFDHHPEDSEVDVVVALKGLDLAEQDGDVVMTQLQVVDYVLARVDRELFLIEDNNDGDVAFRWLKAIDMWGRNVEGAEMYALMHKHGPGFHTPGQKDLVTPILLSAIDWARSEPEFVEIGGEVQERMTRTFALMAVINREASTPLGSADPPFPPTGDIEIDLGLAIQLMRRAVARGPKDDSDPMVAQLDVMLALRERVIDRVGEGALESDIEREFRSEATEAFTNTLDMTQAIIGTLPMPPVPQQLLDAIQRAAQELGLRVEMHDATAGEPFEPLGFDVPEINFDQPEQKKPKSIFDLPELGGPDAPDVRWN